MNPSSVQSIFQQQIPSLDLRSCLVSMQGRTYTSTIAIKRQQVRSPKSILHQKRTVCTYLYRYGSRLAARCFYAIVHLFPALVSDPDPVNRKLPWNSC